MRHPERVRRKLATEGVEGSALLLFRAADHPDDVFIYAEERRKELAKQRKKKKGR